MRETLEGVLSLLPAGSQEAGQDLLALSAGGGAVAAPGFAGDDSRTQRSLGGNINSHGMEMELHHRFSGGLEFTVDYFWNKTITDVQDTGNAHPKDENIQANYGAFIEDPNNRSRDRGISHSTVPQRFVINHTWALPFGKGLRWLNNNRAADLAVGGWTLMGWYAWQSRAWETPLWIGSDFSNTNTFEARPNVLPGCNPNVDTPTAAKTFNAQCFAVPATGQFGNAGKATIMNVQSGFWPNSTLFMAKSFTLAHVLSEEGLRFRIGARLDNPINHPVLGGISNAVNVPGANETSYGGSRQISFNLRLQF